MRWMSRERNGESSFNTHKRNTGWNKTASISKYNRARKQERRKKPAHKGNTQICRLASSSQGGVYTTATFGATYTPESCNTLQYTTISSRAFVREPQGRSSTNQMLMTSPEMEVAFLDSWTAVNGDGLPVRLLYHGCETLSKSNLNSLASTPFVVTRVICDSSVSGICIHLDNTSTHYRLCPYVSIWTVNSSGHSYGLPARITLVAL